MACPEGIEPPTPSLEGWCSVQLSYGQYWTDAAKLDTTHRVDTCLEGSCSIQLSYGQLAVGKMVGVR